MDWTVIRTTLLSTLPRVLLVLIGGILLKWGVTQPQITAITHDITQLVVAVVCILGPLAWGHLKNLKWFNALLVAANTGVADPAPTKTQVAIAQGKSESLTSTTLNTMASRANGTSKDTLSSVLLCIFALSSIHCLSGCTSTLQTADVTVLSLTVTEQGLAVAVQQGLITSKQATALLPYLDAVRSAKTTLVAAADTGDKQTVTLAEQTLSAALAAFNTQYASAKAATAASPILPTPPGVTTAPTTSTAPA